MPDREISNAIPTHSPDPTFVANTRQMLSAAWANPEVGPDDSSVDEPAPRRPEPRPQTVSRREWPTRREVPSLDEARPRLRADRRRVTLSPERQARIVPAAAAALVVLGGLGLYAWNTNSRGPETDLAIAPVTAQPTTTAAASTTAPPTTAATTTAAPTTAPPTLAATVEPSTVAPTTAAPTTIGPVGGGVPPTAAPITAAPSTAAPATAPPPTAAPSTAAPTTAAPTTAPPSTAPMVTTPPSTVKPGGDPFAGYKATEIPKWARVGATAPVTKVLADGVYASEDYSLDDDELTFVLEQRFMGQACWDHFADDPNVEEICSTAGDQLADGRLTEPFAMIPADSTASVVATFFNGPTTEYPVKTYEISFAEFIRGLKDQTAVPMPTADFWLQVRDGRVVSIVSMVWAADQLAPYLS